MIRIAKEARAYMVASPLSRSAVAKRLRNHEDGNRGPNPPRLPRSGLREGLFRRELPPNEGERLAQMLPELGMPALDRGGFGQRQARFVGLARRGEASRQRQLRDRQPHARSRIVERRVRLYSL